MADPVESDPGYPEWRAAHDRVVEAHERLRMVRGSKDEAAYRHDLEKAQMELARIVDKLDGKNA